MAHWPSSPLRTDVIDVYDSIRRVSAEASLANYYRVVFALIRGDINRSPLPFELAIYTIQLARLASPYPSRALSGLLTWHLNRPAVYMDAIARNSHEKLVPLLKTKPLSSDALRAVSKVKVVMKFIENPKHYRADYWNNFYFRLSERAKDNPKDEPREALSWPCFESVTCATRHPDDQLLAPFEPMRRGAIGYDHVIFQYILPGDYLEVMVMTRPVDAPNNYCNAVIRVFETWKPSLEMLKFM
ncbi:hypothetical protein BDV93DRAFT_584687 [Ceratobasidium sp. AG-I]|nr:hypothetical protein BDV93DRAFT_584687 [Ceratobasidium sp. AG-I]